MLNNYRMSSRLGFVAIASLTAASRRPATSLLQYGINCRRPVSPITSLQQYGTTTTDPKVATALDVGSRLEVYHPRWPHSLRLSYPWLRDHCRCGDCFNHTTAQRRFDPSTLQLNIRPARVLATLEGLEVQWPDGHTSSYEYKFLWQNTYEGRRTSHKSPRQLWTARTFPAPDKTTVSLEELNDPQEAGVKKLIAAIIKYGFAFISEVPAEVESTCSAVEKVCPVQHTFFGEMWGLQGTTMEHLDTAYTSEFIGVHTDTTYFSQACRIQVFHCLKEACEGGENLLMDGFNVAKQFKDKHPEGYAFLSTQAIPSEYIEKRCHFMCLDTVFRHNPQTGKLTQFRYNIYDRAPVSSIPMDKMDEFYLHFNDLTKIVQNPNNEHQLKLEPGKVLLIDNWRVMHGRCSFMGPRVMAGCYLANDDFTSRARDLALQLE